MASPSFELDFLSASFAAVPLRRGGRAGARVEQCGWDRDESQLGPLV